MDPRYSQNNASQGGRARLVAVKTAFALCIDLAALMPIPRDSSSRESQLGQPIPVSLRRLLAAPIRTVNHPWTGLPSIDGDFSAAIVNSTLIVLAKA